MKNIWQFLAKKPGRDYLLMLIALLLLAGFSWWLQIALSPLKEGLCIESDNRLGSPGIETS